MDLGYVQWKKNTGFTQTFCSLYLISIYFDYLLGLNKIPCLLYEQLFIYTTICITWFYFKLVLLFVMLICQVRTYVYQEDNCIDWYISTNCNIIPLVFFQLNSKLLSIKLRDRYSWVRSLVGLQQILYNLSLYFSAKHMVLRSDRMVVGFTDYWHLLASFD